jgi:hypothetical protein
MPLPLSNPGQSSPYVVVPNPLSRLQKHRKKRECVGYNGWCPAPNLKEGPLHVSDIGCVSEFYLETGMSRKRSVGDTSVGFKAAFPGFITLHKPSDKENFYVFLRQAFFFLVLSRVAFIHNF